MSSLMKVLDSLKTSDPRFAASIKKWLPLLQSSVKKICALTGEDAEDVLQDLLTGLSVANAIYDVPLYRYDGGLYEEVLMDGSIVCLKSLRTHTQRHCWFWTPLSNVERVKKGKLEFVVGMRIRQQAYDIIKNHQRGKRGCSRTPTGRVIVKAVGGVVKQSYEAENFAHVIEFDDRCHGGSGLFSGYESPESLMGYVQCVERIRKSLNARSFAVFRTLLEDPGLHSPEIAQMLDMPLFEVQRRRKYLQSRAQEFGVWL